MRGPFEKQPSERVRLAVDFQNRIPTGDTVASVTALTAVDLADASDVTATLIDGAGTASGQQVLFWVKAGTDGHRYKVTCRVTSAQGYAREADLEVRVVEE